MNPCASVRGGGASTAPPAAGGGVVLAQPPATDTGREREGGAAVQTTSMTVAPFRRLPPPGESREILAGPRFGRPRVSTWCPLGRFSKERPAIDHCLRDQSEHIFHCGACPCSNHVHAYEFGFRLLRAHSVLVSQCPCSSQQVDGAGWRGGVRGMGRGWAVCVSWLSDAAAGDVAWVKGGSEMCVLGLGCSARWV